MSIEHSPAREGQRFHSVRDLATVFGCDVSTIWRHVRNGTLPQPIKIGGMTRWTDEEIERCVDRAKAERDGAEAAS